MSVTTAWRTRSMLFVVSGARHIEMPFTTRPPADATIRTPWPTIGSIRDNCQAPHHDVGESGRSALFSTLFFAVTSLAGTRRMPRETGWPITACGRSTRGPRSRTYGKLWACSTRGG